MHSVRLFAALAWSGVIGCLVATMLQLLMALAAGDSFGLEGLFILPIYWLFYMIPAVPGAVIVGTPVALILDRFGIVGLTRAVAFTIVGCIAGPAIWALLIRGSVYFSSDPKLTLSIGLCCGLACGLATDRVYRSAA